MCPCNDHVVSCCKPGQRRLTTISARRRSFPILDEALKRCHRTRTRTHCTYTSPSRVSSARARPHLVALVAHCFPQCWHTWMTRHFVLNFVLTFVHALTLVSSGFTHSVSAESRKRHTAYVHSNRLLVSCSLRYRHFTAPLSPCHPDA